MLMPNACKTRIDVKATIKERLGEDFRPYVILGACNPPLAHRALLNEPTVGVMLPCNVTVEQHQTGSRVLIANPVSMMGMADLGENPALRAVADEAAIRLKRVADALKQRAFRRSNCEPGSPLFRGAVL